MPVLKDMKKAKKLQKVLVEEVNGCKIDDYKSELEFLAECKQTMKSLFENKDAI